MSGARHPLRVSKRRPEDLKGYLVFETDEMHFKAIGETVKLATSGGSEGHYVMDLCTAPASAAPFREGGAPGWSTEAE